MSKSSSRDEPVEFQFELDIGESTSPEPLPELKKKEEGVEEACVILKRKAKKPSPGKGSGDLAVREKETEIGQDRNEAGFKPRKLDGTLGRETPGSGTGEVPSRGLPVRRERRELAGLGRQRDSENSIAGAGHEGTFRHFVSLIRDLAGRLEFARMARNKVLIATLLTVTVLGLVRWLLVASSEEGSLMKTAAKGEPAQGAGAVGAGGIVQAVEESTGGLLKAQGAESDADMKLRAGDTLRKFFLKVTF